MPACRVDCLLHLVAMAWLTHWIVQRMLCGYERVVWTAYLGSADWLGGVVNPADEKKALKEHLLMVVRARAGVQLRRMLVGACLRLEKKGARGSPRLGPAARACLRAPVLYLLLVASGETVSLWKGHM